MTDQKKKLYQLQSKDGSLSLDSEIASHILVVKDFFEDNQDDDDEEQVLPINVSQKVLLKAIDFCQYIHDSKCVPKLHPKLFSNDFRDAFTDE